MKWSYSSRRGHISRQVARFIGAALAAFACVSAFAQGETYPVKPVRFMVGQAPGGATDIVGRMVAQKMTEVLGQNVIIENRTGAAGSIAANRKSAGILITWSNSGTASAKKR